MLASSTLLLVSLLGAAPPSPSTESRCAGREPCRVEETLEAGRDVQGRPMRVERLSLGWMSLEEGAASAGRAFGSGRRERQGTPGAERCEAREWWLVRAETPARLLLSLCDDHQGAVREETVEVLDNLFVYTSAGERRGEQWTRNQRLRLSPLRPASEDELSIRPGPTPEERREDEVTWDFETLRGHVTRAGTACPTGAPTEERILPYLPEVHVEPSFLAEGWKKGGLGPEEGGCHLPARSVLLGQDVYRGAGDASLGAVLVQDDHLLLEIRDDVWTGPSDKWLHDDHVELWLGPQPPQTQDGCGKPTAARKPVQWGIRLADGKVFPAFGAPKQPLQVERVRTPDQKGYRLKVKLPPDFEGLSVIYSDSDTGGKQQKMIATSPVKFGRPETLNPVSPAPESRCAVKNGQLLAEPAHELQTPPDRAVLPLKP
ncbi:MAG: hypothetical protein ABW123_29860 [Cystobacter sp.]